MDCSSIIQFVRNDVVFQANGFSVCAEVPANSDWIAGFALERVDVTRFRKSAIPGCDGAADLLSNEDTDAVYVFRCPTAEEIETPETKSRQYWIEEILSGFNELAGCSEEYLVSSAKFIDRHIDEDKEIAFIVRDFDENVFPAEIVDIAVRYFSEKNTVVYCLTAEEIGSQPS